MHTHAHRASLALIVALMLVSALAQGQSRVTPSEDSSHYSISDLFILAKEKNFDEFFAHARDIRPGQRNDQWKKMLLDMGEAYTSDLISKGYITQKQLDKIDDLHTWPALHDHEFFLRNRGRIALRFFTDCYQRPSATPSTCTEALVRFWKKDTRDMELGLKCGALIQANDSVPIDTLWSFYAEGAKSSFAEFYCKRDEVRPILLDRLGQISPVSSDAIDSILHPDCWKVAIPLLKKELKGTVRQRRDSAYALLMSKKALSSQDQDQFLVRYVLGNPESGPLLNRAWATVQQLGKDSNRRESVLHDLQEFDPLPGELFSEKDKARRQTFLRLLALHIPEYLDFYARTCLDYLEGKRRFQNGNPTLQCRDLFLAAQGTDWVAVALQERFRKLPHY